MVIKRKDSPIHALESLTMVTFANNCKDLAVLAVDIDDEDDDECVYHRQSMLFYHFNLCLHTFPQKPTNGYISELIFRCGRESC